MHLFQSARLVLSVGAARRATGTWTITCRTRRALSSSRERFTTCTRPKRVPHKLQSARIPLWSHQNRRGHDQSARIKHGRRNLHTLIQPLQVIPTHRKRLETRRCARVSAHGLGKSLLKHPAHLRAPTRPQPRGRWRERKNAVSWMEVRGRATVSLAAVGSS